MLSSCIGNLSLLTMMALVVFCPFYSFRYGTVVALHYIMDFPFLNDDIWSRILWMLRSDSKMLSSKIVPRSAKTLGRSEELCLRSVFK